MKKGGNAFKRKNVMRKLATLETDYGPVIPIMKQSTNRFLMGAEKDDDEAMHGSPRSGYSFNNAGNDYHGASSLSIHANSPKFVPQLELN